MDKRVAVVVWAADPISQAGIAAGMRQRPDIVVLDGDRTCDAEVGVVVADEVDDSAVQTIRALTRQNCDRVVLVVSQLDDGGLLAAVGAGVNGLLHRSQATPEALARAVQAAANGNGTVPPDVLGKLLTQVANLQRQVLAPQGWTFTGLRTREVEVLKLVAEGLSTREIADRLAYSERTIKNVIHDVTTRLNLRNRSHAVAYAMREGLI